jgi:hypothetical protein
LISRLLGITHQEAVRRLIRILYTKPDSYNKFLHALREGGYEFLAAQIEGSTGEGVSESDLSWAEKGYLHDFQDGLRQQTEMMKQFMQEMRQMKQSQTPPTTASPSPEPLGRVREAMNKHGLTQDEVVKYLEFRINQEDIVDGPADVSSPMSVSLDFAVSSYTQSLTTLLAVDIIHYTTNITNKESVAPPPNIYAKFLRSSVDKIIINYREDFQESVTKLQIRNMNSFSLIAKVLDEVFTENNWGRVLIVFAFCSWLAQQIASDGDDSQAKSVGGFLSYYITRSTKVCDWIAKNGGYVS